MGPGSPPRPPARCRRWLGWTRDTATIAVGLDDDVATVLCLRRRSVITASGRSILAPGTVRDGRIRSAEPAIEALTSLRTDLHLPDNASVVVLVQPRTADVTGWTVEATVEADEVETRSRVLVDAGFSAPILDPVPAALARLPGTNGGPVYAEAAGWKSYRDNGHLEIELSDRLITEAVIGPSPVERAPLLGPAPIAIDRSVTLSRGWPLLLGAALADSEVGPMSRIEEIPSSLAGGWTIERVTDDNGGPR